jgi:site-specific recombinase XerD
LITAGDGIRAYRERALLSVGYDTMARGSEFVALDVEDSSFLSKGARPRFHKNDLVVGTFNTL